jgi:hypothetical protein
MIGFVHGKDGMALLRKLPKFMGVRGRSGVFELALERLEFQVYLA